MSQRSMRSLRSIESTDSASAPRRKKKFRAVRKKIAKATGAHHVIRRTRRFFFPKKKDEEGFSETEEEEKIPTISEEKETQLLESDKAREIVAKALPERLRGRRLRRRYAARLDGYDLASLSRRCADLANKPVVIVMAVDATNLVGCFLGSAPFGTVSRVTAETKGASLEASVFKFLTHKPDHACFACQPERLFDDPGAFVIAARTPAFLAVAANAQTGGAALRLNSDLSSASTEASPLFQSPQLHKPDFDVQDVEVYALEIPT
ncbi:hypothetical protein CTAYLR_000510 [Chrysophaeum taylorii]|uniref:Oxidation resistance protein 1 n=1 Tax=Chrysophaeum taylorii TaxID=2483200 RepID=A0AAD7XMA9_9STRA|nr:hypothetical protein CTAYLR_000510 [Chrysophaeum taylorii]